MRSTQPTLILALPAHVRSNPYFDILYGAVRNDSQYAIEPFSFSRAWSAVFTRRRVIIHIHWETALYGSRHALISALRYVSHFPMLWLLRCFDVRVVWTIHNLSPHEHARPGIDELARATMWLLSNAVIIQNKEYAQYMTKLHPLKRVVYIPHPSYGGHYSLAAPAARTCRRAMWGVHPGEIVLLSLGAIRPYKKLEVLIAAVARAQNIRLVIAGKGEPAYVDRLTANVPPHVLIENRYIPDQEVAEYLAGADYAIFAYDKTSLTSGAVVLALSYGIPAIVLSMPAAELVQNGVNGYKVEDDSQLKQLLETLPTAPLLDQATVIGTMENCTPGRVAEFTRALYATVL